MEESLINIDNILLELDKKERAIRIKQERRRYRKIMSVIYGIPKQELEDTARRLKKHLACGGTVKNGHIEIQYRDKNRIIDELKSMGYKNIECV